MMKKVELMNKNDMILKNKANEELAKIFYKDAKKNRKILNEKIFRNPSFVFVDKQHIFSRRKI